MRKPILRFASGVAVLCTTLSYGHLCQHVLGHHGGEFGVWRWPLVVLAVAVGVLSLIGGFLLLGVGRSRAD